MWPLLKTTLWPTLTTTFAWVEVWPLLKTTLWPTLTTTFAWATPMTYSNNHFRVRLASISNNHLWWQLQWRTLSMINSGDNHLLQPTLSFTSSDQLTQKPHLTRSSMITLFFCWTHMFNDLKYIVKLLGYINSILLVKCSIYT